MPRLRSQTRRPALRVLPRDVLARCIEFLPFDQALESKQVSKEVRSAARRAIARGRWRPVKFVAERALDLVLATVRRPGRPAKPVSAAALSTFRAAWEIDPGQVVREIAEWQETSRVAIGTHAAIFLELVEPTIDGLPRVLAACERTHRFLELFTRNSSDSSSDDEDQPYRPRPHINHHTIHMLVSWSEGVGRPLKLNFHGEDEEDLEDGLYIATWFNESTEYDAEHFGSALFGSGLEAWDDPKLAARFVFALLEEKLDGIGFVDMSDHRRWSRDWQDRDKARAFVNAAWDLDCYCEN